MSQHVAGNGDRPETHTCAYDGSHRFTSLDARLQHEPSCPANPTRVDERDNPERDT